MTKSLMIIACILACLLVIIVLLSGQRVDAFTEFPVEILKMVDLPKDEPESELEIEASEPITNPVLSTRPAPTACTVSMGPDIIQADKVKSKTIKNLHVLSPLDVTGILDVNALKINNQQLLRYDNDQNSFVFG